MFTYVRKIKRKVFSRFYVLLKEAFGEFFVQNKIALNNSTVSLDFKLSQDIVLLGFNSVGKGVKTTGKILIGKYSTINDFCYLLGGEIIIGNYTQLGSQVSIHSTEHNSGLLTLYNSQKMFNGEIKSMNISKVVKIGHGVWIGHGAIILKGIEIGNGSIIGAGSVVTKNVGEYEIWGGNPARKIRDRFNSADVKDFIEAYKWWELDPKSLLKNKELFFIDFNNESMDLKLFSVK
jgi:virginiamycin A acetyltransferase